jgi:hypothetical protein
MADKEANPPVGKAGQVHQLITVPVCKEGNWELFGSVKADDLCPNQA